jgi:hypothetical protein
MTAPTAWWPVATRRPVPNTASPHPGEGDFLYDAAGRFTLDPLGWVLHVVVGNGSPFGTFAGAKSPRRRFSHVWIAKDGDVEQYGPFSHKSWANGNGNGTYYSAETEGLPTEPLTDAQLQRLAEFHVFTRTADRIAGGVGERGIVCHYQGGADWGGHSCPDPDAGRAGTAVPPARRHPRSSCPDQEPEPDDGAGNDPRPAAPRCHRPFGRHRPASRPRPGRRRLRPGHRRGRPPIPVRPPPHPGRHRGQAHRRRDGMPVRHGLAPHSHAPLGQDERRHDDGDGADEDDGEGREQ